ncbi:hypothetical protein XENOCAPTIV_010873, partial [Xenoophorus captivus]
ILLMCFALQKCLLEVLYEIFRLPVPIVTEDFMEALQSVGEDSSFFFFYIVKVHLHFASQADLMDNYLAFVLSAFISSGLLENLEWNWLLIATILKVRPAPMELHIFKCFMFPHFLNNVFFSQWPNVSLRNNKDEQMHRFVRRLLYFYKPTSKLYAGLALDHVKARQLTDGQGYLEDLVRDMVSWLCSCSGLKPERSLQSNGLLTTLSQHYFLFLGTLSAHPQGVKMLEKCGLFQWLYATKHLRVLLRAGVEFFSSWGMELLVTQLHDHNKVVSMEALDILDEACEDKLWLTFVLSILYCMLIPISSLFLDMYILDDDRCDGLDSPDDPSFYPHSKAVKDRSPFTILGSTRFVRPRFLNSLSLPSKKPRSTSDPKSCSGCRTPTEPRTDSPRRNRTVTEPSVHSPNQGDVFTSVFNGRGMPKSPTVSLETSFVGTRGSSEEQLVDGRLVRGGGSGLGLSGLGGHGVVEHHREQSSRERLAGDGGSGGGNVGGGGTQFKSRSQSFNTDTTTSGISSMSSSPSRETVGNSEHPDVEPDSSDCVSLNTVVSAKTVKTLSSLTPQPQTNHMSSSKSPTVSLVPPGSSHTLPRRAQSLKSPSVITIKSLADCSFIYTSPRDALGYATLKRLQQQRIHPSLSHSDALASPAKDVLFTDTITMKTGSLDSRLTPRRLSRTLVPRWVDLPSVLLKELLSPINQSTLHRCSSVRSMVSSATFGCNDDYIGLALPMNINDMFHIRDSTYFQQRISPPSEERKRFLFGDRPALPLLKQQFSISELIASRGDTQNNMVDSEETGLQDHCEENCLYCVGASVLGYLSQPQINSTHSRTGEGPSVCLSFIEKLYGQSIISKMIFCVSFLFPDYVDFPSWGGQGGHRLEVMPQSKFSGVSGCSDAAVSQGSISSTPTPGDVVIGKNPDTNWKSKLEP